MTDLKKVVVSLENGVNGLVQAHELIEQALYQKAGGVITERKKLLVAKTWGAAGQLKEDAKSIFNKSKRQALKNKMVKAKKDKK
jgi:hypothetical protein